MQYYSFTPSLFIVIGLMMSADLPAQPFVPDSNAQILATLPLNNSSDESNLIKSLKQDLRNTPDDPETAYRLANLYITLGREQSDPRYYGLAEALIQPWWNNTQITQLMIIQAQILAYNHEFTEALAILNDLAKTGSQIDQQTQAELTVLQANIYQIIGDYASSRKNCGQLVLKTSPLISAACFFSIDAFTAKPQKTRQRIRQLHTLLENSKNAPQDIKIWVLSLLAEAASLNHDETLAETFLLNGLQYQADHTYLLALYADLLLKQNRLHECIALLETHINQTALLVRLLTAESRLANHFPSRLQQSHLDVQIREDKIKQDQRHYREYAYYHLYVLNNYQSALHFALVNWENQKELSDSLILYRAAHQLQKTKVLKMLDQWIEKNNIQIDFSHQSLSL